MRVDPTELETYLHDHIPLSAAMGVSVRSADLDSIVLDAPLGPNINHRDTVFGGSASALAILAAWSLVHVRLRDAGVPCRLVIQRNRVEYTAAMLGDFSAVARLADPSAWERFAAMLNRRGMARIDVVCELTSGERSGGRFEGTFVAIDTNRHDGAIQSSGPAAQARDEGPTQQ
jgi:thioesterase domain-containing protein